MKKPVNATSLFLLIILPKQPVNVPLSSFDPNASGFSGVWNIAERGEREEIHWSSNIGVNLYGLRQYYTRKVDTVSQDDHSGNVRAHELVQERLHPRLVLVHGYVITGFEEFHLQRINSAAVESSECCCSSDTVPMCQRIHCLSL